MAARGALLAVCLSIAIPVPEALPEGDNDKNEPPPPWTLSRRDPGEPRWGPLLRIRAMEADYRDGRWSGAYAQILAQAEASAGNHAAALRLWDSVFLPPDSTGALPAGTIAADAIEYLSHVADTAQVIIVNERHHAGSDRLLTLQLLPVLRERGFRYFAAETFSHRDTTLASRGYPTDETGAYVAEPVFAAVVREALRLGYVLVPYESTEEQSNDQSDLTPQQRRDLAQARNLNRAIFAKDPDARVLVHAGYSHILEHRSERWYPMALYLRELTGIDPVTVDQTRLSERSTERYEHPDYRASIAAGLLQNRSIVLLDAENRPYLPADFQVDIQVLTPRTTYSNGRPNWMSLGGRRNRIDVDVPECADRRCFIEARIDGEPAEALPVDWTEANEATEVQLYLPPGEPVVIQVFSETGELLQSRNIAPGNERD